MMPNAFIHDSAGDFQLILIVNQYLTDLAVTTVVSSTVRLGHRSPNEYSHGSLPEPLKYSRYERADSSKQCAERRHDPYPV